MSDSEDEAPDKQLKIIIMGDGASGKVKFLNSCVVFSNHENKTCTFSTRFLSTTKITILNICNYQNEINYSIYLSIILA